MTSAPATGALVLLIVTATILAALGFEHLGGYVPCHVCLAERYAYYAGVPLAALGLILFGLNAPRAASLVFVAVALFFIANAALAAYHAGFEWGLWPGPATCSGVEALPATTGDLLDRLRTRPMVRCDTVSWRFAGLSFAGWDVVISLLLFVLAARTARCVSNR